MRVFTAGFSTAVLCVVFVVAGCGDWFGEQSIADGALERADRRQGGDHDADM